MKNTCAKTVNVNTPYAIYRNDSGWEWRILKKYQNPEQESKNEFSRWFCAVKSPMTFGTYDLGDVYVLDVIRNGVQIDFTPNTLEKW